MSGRLRKSPPTGHEAVTQRIAGLKARSCRRRSPNLLRVKAASQQKATLQQDRRLLREMGGPGPGPVVATRRTGGQKAVSLVSIVAVPWLTPCPDVLSMRLQSTA